jgi:molybdopterin synthase catalytic subunit
MTISGSDWVALADQPIDAARVRAYLTKADPADRGGICVFEGCTRSEQHAEHGALLRLDYQAYDTMALKQMQQLAAEARRQWPIGALAIVHRVGQVAIGEASIIIGVASSHRAEAFTACRWLIDALKQEVPIWKKEVWQSRAETWSEAEGSNHA